MQLQSNPRKRGTALINVTSLIDVVLLLLLFFMLTTRFVEQPGMKLDLPDTSANKSAEAEGVTILINSDGEIYLNDIKTDLMNLGFELTALIDTAYAENTLILKADSSVKHGLVVEIMDNAQLAGFQKLVVATEKKGK